MSHTMYALLGAGVIFTCFLPLIVKSVIQARQRARIAKAWNERCSTCYHRNRCTHERKW